MIKFFKPKSTLLSEFIDCYYVFDKEVIGSGEISYIAFPHVNTVISFFKGTDINRQDHEIIFSPVEYNDNEYKIEMLGKFTRPIFVHYRGYCEQISIVFKPLGVNNFFSKDLVELSPNFSQELNEKVWKFFACDLFKREVDLIDCLENFLESQYMGLKDQKMYKAIKLLENANQDVSINNIAAQCGLSLKSFQRSFKKNLACTPIEYKRICRFRTVIDIMKNSRKNANFTQVAFESNYYDQSYFNREFKKLTFYKPTLFLSKIKELEQKKVIWILK